VHGDLFGLLQGSQFSSSPILLQQVLYGIRPSSYGLHGTKAT